MDRFYKMMKRNNKGFTLVELMVVLLIIGILVAIAIPIYNSTQKKAKETACEANIRTIEGAAAQYHAEIGEWPTSVNDLVSKTVDDKSYSYLKEEPKCPFDETKGYAIDDNEGKVTCGHCDVDDSSGDDNGDDN
jgi:type II secretion system protein G